MADDAKSPRSELFPPTANTQIGRMLGAGAAQSLNHHVMAVYFDPLRKYLRGARTIRNAAAKRRLSGSAYDDFVTEIVTGFFSDRLAKSNYLHAWFGSGRRLNQYLRNGLWFYVHELFRLVPREEQREPIHEDDALVVDDVELELDRSYVRRLVQEAMEQSRRLCERKGFGAHWEILKRHICDEQPYAELPKELGVTPQQAAFMLRTASGKFERTFRDLVRAHVSSPELVNRAIESFLDVVES